MYQNYTTKSRKKNNLRGTPIKAGGRVVGHVIPPDYVKNITNRHMLRIFPAIANDLQSLRDAEAAGAVYCVFTNTDTGVIYKTTIEKIWRLGKRINFVSDQIALGLEHWTQSRGLGYIAPTDPPTIDPPNSGGVIPLEYTSHAPQGVTWHKAGGQLELFGDGK